MNQRKLAWFLCIWVILTLFLSQFHEPWRDEAQAWLVARSSHSLKDIWQRSAWEGTGPVYYLILWPFARFFPEQFPILIYILSWLGTFGALLSLSMLNLFPNFALLGILGSVLFSYEYAAIARLYGWGLFFFLLGVFLARKKSRWGHLVCFSLACFTQLNFTFLVVAWTCYETLKSRKLSFETFFLIGITLISITHLQVSGPLGHWERPGWIGLAAPRIGNTLGNPFFHLCKPGIIGFPIFLISLFCLRSLERISFLVGLLLQLTFFMLLYSGENQLRHAGVFFIYWLLLIFLNWENTQKWSRYWVGAILILSFVASLRAWRMEILLPFSDGMAAANAIQNRLQGNQTPRIYVDNSMLGFVVAARLNTSLYHESKSVGFPFFAENERVDSLHTKAFYVGNNAPDSAYLNKMGKWTLIKAKETAIVLDESINVFELSDTRSDP